MNRLASILLLVGGVLLLSYAIAPAQPATPPHGPKATIEQTASIAERVDADVVRLRERLSTPVTYPPASRDPFRYGRRVAPPAAIPATPDDTPVAEASPSPKLLAILTEKSETGAVYRAVFSFAGSVTVARAGERVSVFTVRTISADGAELVDESSSRILRLTLK